MKEPCYFRPLTIGFPSDKCYLPRWATDSRYWPINIKDHGPVFAHRLVYTLTTGPIDNGEYVLHRCGESRCVNPAHLYAGGDAENTRDAILHKLARGSLAWFQRDELLRDLVYMPTVSVLSSEISQRAEFAGFSPEDHYTPPWFNQTVDGFLQWGSSDRTGDEVGLHRFVYLVFVGPLNKLDIVSTHCGVMDCLNPYHLYISGSYSPAEYNALYDKRCVVTPDDGRRKENKAKRQSKCPTC